MDKVYEINICVYIQHALGPTFSVSQTWTYVVGGSGAHRTYPRCEVSDSRHQEAYYLLYNLFLHLIVPIRTSRKAGHHSERPPMIIDHAFPFTHICAHEQDWCPHLVDIISIESDDHTHSSTQAETPSYYQLGVGKEERTYWLVHDEVTGVGSYHYTRAIYLRDFWSVPASSR